ncbi:hypothetical protein BKA66DRAFT_575632 [Pyrenochaeta sp. MPI-SDFR-AT-0127]|nr:hypothetical protein BKA66DRAFT_575632 [Pyrenochaeta sp. MPI-SDFR-AT-0127]
MTKGVGRAESSECALPEREPEAAWGSAAKTRLALFLQQSTGPAAAEWGLGGAGPVSTKVVSLPSICLPAPYRRDGAIGQQLGNTTRPGMNGRRRTVQRVTGLEGAGGLEDWRKAGPLESSERIEGNRGMEAQLEWERSGSSDRLRRLHLAVTEGVSTGSAERDVLCCVWTEALGGPQRSFPKHPRCLPKSSETGGSVYGTVPAKWARYSPPADHSPSNGRPRRTWFETPGLT